MGAVKNAFQRDGLDPSIMDLDHDKSVSSQLDPKKKAAAKAKLKKTKVRRKKVYWNKVDAKEGTVWSTLQKLEVNLTQDMEEFERLFAQAIDADKEKEKKEAAQAKAKTGKTVKVIE